jgi:hypothetical protein
MAYQMNIFGVSQKDLLYILTHLFNHFLGLDHFPAPWKEAKTRTLPKPGKDIKFSPNLRPISLLSTAN